MRIHLLVPLVTALSIGPARADDWSPLGINATWENDIFGGLDRHYTNGVELSLFGRVPLGDSPFFVGDRPGQWRLTLGQRIFTPEDLEAPDLLLDDRPYAGWTWLGASLRRWGTTVPYTDRIGVELGLLGPESGAGAIHELFHGELTGSSPPRGWKHQLASEVGVRFIYELAFRMYRTEVAGLGFEVEPRLEASFGNVQTYAAVAAAVRLGRLPDPHSERSGAGPFVYLTLGGEVRFVAHDVFLDGSLLRTGGHRVSGRRVVSDLQAGITVELPGGLSLSYTHTYRTQEFRDQDGPDQFGSLSVLWSW